MQRIDDAKAVSDRQQGLGFYDWATQRTAWRDGTLVKNVDMKSIEDVAEVYKGRGIPLMVPERRFADDPLVWLRQQRERLSAQRAIVATRCSQEGSIEEGPNLCCTASCARSST